MLLRHRAPLVAHGTPGHRDGSDEHTRDHRQHARHHEALRGRAGTAGGHDEVDGDISHPGEPADCRLVLGGHPHVVCFRDGAADLVEAEKQLEARHQVSRGHEHLVALDLAAQPLHLLALGKGAHPAAHREPNHHHQRTRQKVLEQPGHPQRPCLVAARLALVAVNVEPLVVEHAALAQRSGAPRPAVAAAAGFAADAGRRVDRARIGDARARVKGAVGEPPVVGQQRECLECRVGRARRKCRTQHALGRRRRRRLR